MLQISFDSCFHFSSGQSLFKRVAGLTECKWTIFIFRSIIAVVTMSLDSFRFISSQKHGRHNEDGCGNKSAGIKNRVETESGIEQAH